MTSSNKEETTLKRSSVTMNLQFLIYMTTLLLGLGISIGTFQLSVSTLRADNENTKTDIKEMRSVYLRTDLFEARQKALEDQLREISDQIKEIKTFLFKSKAR